MLIVITSSHCSAAPSSCSLTNCKIIIFLLLLLLLASCAACTFRTFDGKNMQHMHHPTNKFSAPTWAYSTQMSMLLTKSQTWSTVQASTSFVAASRSQVLRGADCRWLDDSTPPGLELSLREWSFAVLLELLLSLAAAGESGDSLRRLLTGAELKSRGLDVAGFSPLRAFTESSWPIWRVSATWSKGLRPLLNFCISASFATLA